MKAALPTTLPLLAQLVGAVLIACALLMLTAEMLFT
jgi:hypothetical protein